MTALMEQADTAVNRLTGMVRARRRRSLVPGIAIVSGALLCAALTFVILVGLTPIKPSGQVTWLAIAFNGLFAIALLVLIGLELRQLWLARRNQKAASRLHVRIVAFFAIIASMPAIIIAIVASVTLDLGLDRWFELRTRSIVDSSRQVTEAYINENAINLRDATINMAFALDSQRVLFNLDRLGFRQLLTQQARGRGMLGASVLRPDGTVVHSADINTDRPLPLAPQDALEAALDGNPVIIPPGGTNLVGAVIQLREINDAYLYTIRTIDSQALDAVRLMEQARNEYGTLENNRASVQIAFALLYFGVTLTLMLAAIWSAIAVADRIVRPIRALIGAASEVSEGNMDVRVPVRSSDGDVGALSETFNAMLGQLKTQRDEILSAKDQIDVRRRFSEAVLSGVSAGVFGVDETGNLKVANAPVVSILDLKAMPTEGTHLAALSPQINNFFLDTLQTGRSAARRQITFIGRNGRERVLNVQIEIDDMARRERDVEPHNATHVITIDDVSDLVEAQRAGAWADVARRIAHEIKNPLTPIQLSTERIQRRYRKVIAEDDREVFDRCTETIVRQVSDIGRMVDEFSSFARMPKPQFKRGDLREPLREAFFLVEVSRSDIQFEHAFPDTPVMALFDERLIGQAIGNLIKNATEAIDTRRDSDAEGADAPGRVLVRALVEKAGEQVTIEVIDNGRGFPAHARQKLLEPYMTTREKGTGLGLAIVRKIVEDHGGAIFLEDAPADFAQGRGACVRVVMALKPVAETAGKTDESGEKRT